MPEIEPFTLTLLVVGLIAGCVFARSVRLVLGLALVGVVYFTFRNGVDLDSASDLLVSLADEVGGLFTAVDPMAWVESLLEYVSP